jgi:hypothetical protein
MASIRALGILNLKMSNSNQGEWFVQTASLTADIEYLFVPIVLLCIFSFSMGCNGSAYDSTNQENTSLAKVEDDGLKNRMNESEDVSGQDEVVFFYNFIGDISFFHGTGNDLLIKTIGGEFLLKINGDVLHCLTYGLLAT